MAFVRSSFFGLLVLIGLASAQFVPVVFDNVNILHLNLGADPENNIVDCGVNDVNQAQGTTPLGPLAAATFEFWFYNFENACGAGEGFIFWYGNATHYIAVSLAPNLAVIVRSRFGGALLTATLPTGSQFNHLAIAGNATSVLVLHTTQASGGVDLVVDAVTTNLVFPANIPNAVLVIGQKLAAIAGVSGARGASALISDLRVWNFVKTAAQINAEKLVSLSGTESGLLAYWRFDDPAGSTTTVDLIQARTLTFSGSFTRSTAGINAGVTAFTPMLPLFVTVNRIIPASTTAIPILLGLSGNQNMASATVAGVKGNLCLGASTSCTGLSNPYNPDFTTQRVLVTWVPTREGCGLKPWTVTAAVSQGTTPTTALTLNLNLAITTTAFTLTIADTVSPFAFIPDGTLGLLGPLASSEQITIQLRGDVFNCTNALVNAASITCNNPGFPGVGNATISLCGQVFVSQFSFPTPLVNTIQSFNFDSITLKGSFFGTARSFDNNIDVLTVTDAGGAPVTGCTANVIDDTTVEITCDANALVLGTDYTVVVNMGGLQVSNTFNYQVCNPGCQNGGVCVGLNLCQCDVTKFTGAQCQNAVISTPLAAIVAPSVVGSAILIAAIVVGTIAIYRYRNPKRGGKTFIPLEKKDFSKIIYGDTTSPNGKIPGDLDRLEELLLQDNLELAFTLSNVTQITEADEISKAMVIVFQSNNKIDPLMRAFIADEVRNSESSGTLFRSNSMVSKMFKFYSRLIALPYLYVTIGPEINELLEQQLGLEVDPEKIEEGTDLDQMRWTLMAQSQKILKQILVSGDTCPNEFKQTFAHLKECVSERWPESVNVTIGGFIFLRFFCPAISSPEAYGLCEEPPSQSARRLLILITKVLQNLSNDIEFGSKEMYMTKMNDFIQTNRGKLASFYDKLIKSQDGNKTPVDMPKNMRTACLHIIANHLKENMSKITDEKMKSKINDILN